MRLAAILALCATPALADRDHIEIHPHGTAEALVIYHNSASTSSDNGTTTVQIEVQGVVIVVDVTIAVNAGDLGQCRVIRHGPVQRVIQQHQVHPVRW